MNDYLLRYPSRFVRQEPVRLPQHLETPASRDPRDWYKHSITLGDMQYDIGGVVVLGPIPDRLPSQEEVLVINVPLPRLFLQYLSRKMRGEARLHLTAVALKELS